MRVPTEVFRLAVFVCVGTLAAAAAAAAPGEKQLARVRGTVQYQTAPSAPYHRLVGSLELPDDAVAVTLADSQGLLRLPDSSEVDIGARARVRVGAFNAVVDSGPNVTIALEVGALHFTVRHPPGSRSTYRFVTATTQIAVRGTEGYLVTGPTGTDFYCASCEPGDVTLQVGERTIPLETGQQVIVDLRKIADARTAVFKAPCVNPAAIAISAGKLGRTIPRAKWVDTTGALGADPLQPVPLVTPVTP